MMKMEDRMVDLDEWLRSCHICRGLLLTIGCGRKNLEANPTRVFFLLIFCYF